MNTNYPLRRRPPECAGNSYTWGRVNLSVKFVMIACFVLVATAAVVGVTAAPSAEDTVMLSNQRPVPPLTAEELKRQLGGEIGEAIGAKKKFKAKRKKLHGRFLHISDIHPDPHYTPHSSPFNACHMPIATDPQAEKRRKKPDEGDDDSGDESELAGHFGAPTTSCDSPQALVNATFDWIKKELMGEDVEDGKGIDFVIWTGDSARHDNDVQRPRTEKEIMELNEMVVDKMKEVFGDKDGMGDENPGNDFKIPIIPTLGNNDIMPHNIFLPGPSTLTREYLRLWRGFIPEDQYHIFDRGAYFWKEVIPGNKPPDALKSPSSKAPPPAPPDRLHHGGLAVISLNTLYFFSSNSAVDGCDLHSEPGYEQFEWLRNQLTLMRDLGMKAILIGHVPPARVREVGWREGGKDDWEVGWGKRSWDETCWRKWVLWNKQFRDVIGASIFGHMNLDHFMLLDTEELNRPHKPGKGKGNGKGKGKGKGSGKKNKRSISYPEKSQPTSRNPNTTLLPYRSQPKIMMTQDSDENTGDQIITITSAEDYLMSLRETFERLPKKLASSSSDPSTPEKSKAAKEAYKGKIGGKFGERFVVNLVGPSVIPNYFPTLRIVEYNISGLVDDQGYMFPTEDEGEEEAEIQTHDSTEESTRSSEYKPDLKRRDITTLTKGSKKPKNPKPKDPIPDPPPKGALPGPAYNNQPFTLLGYTQLYANLTRINDAADKARAGNSTVEEGGEFYYEVEYNTRTDKVYKLKDMTVRSYLKLAARLVDARGGSRKGGKGDGKKRKKPKKGKGDGKGKDKTAEEEEFDFDDFGVEVEDYEEEEGVDYTEEHDPEDYEGEYPPQITFGPETAVDDKKKKKHRHRKKGDKRRDWIWREFLNRAFVRTASKKELDELVGYKG